MNAAEAQRQQLLDDIRALPDEALQEALSFIAQLRQKSASTKVAEQSSEPATQSPYEALKESGLIGCIKDAPSDLSINYKQYLAEGWRQKYSHHLSLQEIARLPVNERHQLLEEHVAETAEDFASDPALTEFSEIDMDDWSADNVGA